MGIGTGFNDAIVMVSLRRDLRQVGDTKYLPLFTK